MKNYVFIYYTTQHMDGPNDAVMAAWQKWFGTLGDKLVDGGNPFNTGAKAVDKSGVMDVSMPSSGYSVIKAASMDEAVEIAKGCPVLEGGSVCVYETMPM